MNPGIRHVAALGVLAFVYVVSYPNDLSAILGPLEKVLAVSNAVSPWLYGVIAVGILSWAALRLWGSKPTKRSETGCPTNLNRDFCRVD